MAIPFTGIFRFTSTMPIMTCLMLVCAMPMPADIWAQEEDPEKGGKLTLEEVVVTASKLGYEESLQSVPISIVALDEQTLERSGAKDFMDFARMVPSVQIIDSGFGSPQVAMRGVRASIVPTTTTQEKPLTGIYYDDIPVSFANFNPNFDLFDLQRVEVLRGPQGTLYGAGAMGGTVRFVTNRPDLTSWGGKAEATFASISEGGEIYDLKGLLNIPVVEDKMAVRITATSNSDGGYVDNIFLGEEDWNRSERKGLRASALFTPNERLSVYATFLYQDMEFDQGRGTINVPGLENPKQSAYGAYPFLDEIAIGNFVVEYDLDWGNFYSSTSYFDRSIDESGSAQEIIESSFGIQIGNPNQVLWDNQDFVQEFRLSSKGDERLNWLVGAFYADQKSDYLQEFRVPGLEDMFGIPCCIFGAPADVMFFGDIQNKQKQYALFGEATYKFTDALHFTTGLRWFDWEQQFDLLYAGLFQGGLYTVAGETSASEFTPKFNLSYHASEEWMVYGNIAKGYRLGGLNDPVPVDLCAEDLNAVGLTEAPLPFAPDSLWSYEIGSKASLLENRMTLNAAAFYIDWTDVQTLKNLPSCGFYFTENVGEVESKGLEVEMVVLLAEGLTLSIAGTYTDATLAADVANLSAVEGDRVPYTPEFAASASLEYFRPLTNSWEGYFRFDLQHVGSRNTEFNEPSGVEMDAYQIANVHIGVQSTTWEVSLFAKNIFDERAVLSAGNYFGNLTYDIERPRTVGVTVRTHF